MAKLGKLSRTTAHRKAMLRSQVTSLLEHGKIETTAVKAKESQRMAEKMITIGKKQDMHARRQALRYIRNEDVVTKLFEEIAPGYSERNGGYTRILKLGPRRGDGTEMAILELV